MTEWFENGRFWEALYPAMFGEAMLARSPEEVEKVCANVGFTGGDVLDLCCGPGRHSVAFAQRGARVTGVDRTPFLFDKARARGRQEGVEVEWVLEDMRRFVRPGAFDLAINLFTSFGYFEDESDNLLALRNVHEDLRAGGALVMDVVAKEWIARVFQPCTVSDLADGRSLIQRHEVLDDWPRMRNEWILLDGEHAERFRFAHTIYSGRELKALLLEAGFSEVRLFGTLTGDPYGQASSRLVALARKAAHA